MPVKLTNEGIEYSDGTTMTTKARNPGVIVGVAVGGLSFYQIDGTETFNCLLTAVGGGGSGARSKYNSTESYDFKSLNGGGGGGGVFKVRVLGATKITWIVGEGAESTTGNGEDSGQSGNDTIIEIIGGEQEGTITCPGGRGGRVAHYTDPSTVATVNVTGSSSLVALFGIPAEGNSWLPGYAGNDSYNTEKEASGGLGVSYSKVGLLGIGGKKYRNSGNGTYNGGKGKGYGSGGGSCVGGYSSSITTGGYGSDGTAIIEFEQE
jgi:hypothetical protein